MPPPPPPPHPEPRRAQASSVLNASAPEYVPVSTRTNAFASMTLEDLLDARDRIVNNTLYRNVPHSTARHNENQPMSTNPGFFDFQDIANRRRLFSRNLVDRPAQADPPVWDSLAPGLTSGPLAEDGESQNVMPPGFDEYAASMRALQSEHAKRSSQLRIQRRQEAARQLARSYQTNPHHINIPYRTGRRAQYAWTSSSTECLW